MRPSRPVIRKHNLMHFLTHDGIAAQSNSIRFVHTYILALHFEICIVPSCIWVSAVAAPSLPSLFPPFCSSSSFPFHLPTMTSIITCYLGSIPVITNLKNNNNSRPLHSFWVIKTMCVIAILRTWMIPSRCPTVPSSSGTN